MPHRKKILLSDSNEALSMLLADSLRERGNFHVFHAKDEDETTKALHRHRPHVLLLDFLLPPKGAPTASNKNPVKNVMNLRTLFPRYFPTISGRLVPSWRIESIPEK